MAELDLKTFILTDEIIKQFSGDRVIENGGNLNLRKDRVLEPVPGGLYDSKFFGSTSADSCNCRAVKKVNVYCHICNSTLLDEETRNTRFARIELPFYYLPFFKKEGLVKFIRETFNVRFEFLNDEEITKGSDKIVRCLELGEVRIEKHEDRDKPTLVIHDQFTSVDLLSYEGLVNVMNAEGMHSEVQEMTRFIDKLVLVPPASMRGISFTRIEGVRQLTMPYSTSIYTSIIKFIQRYQQDLNKRKSVESEAIIRGGARAYFRKALLELSEFNRSSKESLARRMYDVRVGNTSRSVISVGPELATDEVSYPIQNAYAVLKSRFIQYLQDSEGKSLVEAHKMYNRGSSSTLELFEEWVEKVTPIAILVRQPILHKYNLMAFKLKLHRGHDLKMPPETCQGFAGDFDFVDHS